MEKILYSDDNLNNLTKKLIKILNIKISNDNKTIELITRCKNIVNDTIIEVNNKYGINLKACMANIEKINNKCLSNCIKKIQIYLQQISQQQNTQQQNTQQQNNNVSKLEPFENSGGFATLSSMPSTGIMNATGTSGMLNQQNNNNISKKEGRAELMNRLETIKNETTEFMRNQTQPNQDQQENNFNVAEWLGLTTSNQQLQQNNNQQNNNQQNNNQQHNNQQHNNQQHNNQHNNQQFNNQQNNNQQNNNQQFNSYSQSNNNVGASFDEAYIDINPNNNQQSIINESDPNKRLELLNKSRNDIDNNINKYQNGEGFNPKISSSEYNKQKGLFF